MHPDLYLVVYRQQERELESRLEHQRSRAARTAGRPRSPQQRPSRFAALAALRRHAVA